MKYQRGVALSGLLFWGFVIIMVAVLGMKVAPTFIDYTKVLRDSKAVIAQVGPDATVADVRAAYRRYSQIDQLPIEAELLDVSKSGNQIVISFAYDKRIPLFANVSLLIEYKGSTAGQ